MTPDWLGQKVRRREITRREASDLWAWAERARIRITCLETQRVFYSAREGENTTAIISLADLVGSIRRHARQLNDGTIVGSCRERLVLGIAAEVLTRASGYLREMVDTDEDAALLDAVVGTTRGRRAS